MKRAILILTLLGCSPVIAAPPEADWWRGQVAALVGPMKSGVGYRSIHTEPNQTIVIDGAVVWFRLPDNNKPILVTADRITIKPAGKPNLANALAIESIEMERPILNCALEGNKPTPPLGIPTTLPSLDFIQEVTRTLKSVEIHDGTAIFVGHTDSRRASIARITLNGSRTNEKAVTAAIQFSVMDAVFHDMTGSAKFTIPDISKPLEMKFELTGLSLRLSETAGVVGNANVEMTPTSPKK